MKWNRWFGVLLAGYLASGWANDIGEPNDFANILASLPKTERPYTIPQPPLIQLHQSLLQRVRTTPAEWLSTPEGGVHRDYHYFLQKTIPAFAKANALPPHPQDPHLLAYYGHNQPHGAELIFTGLPHTLPQRGHQLEVTAAYTSDIQYPVGFFAVQGRVINPAVQPWEGLVTVSANGQLEIRHAGDVSLTGRTLQWTTSQQDYRLFVQQVEERKLSVFQSHLLIGMGRNLVKNLENQPKVPRRVLFRDRMGGVGIYDSLEEPLTLFEVAEILLQNFQPFHAVNLDMGSYNFCVYYFQGGPQQQCGVPKPKAHLSNLLRLTLMQ
ncbi:MAG: hypothetical protein G8345_08230 [Magnetococcales bacterium]|nr:hypothetical protein [Magnetococcales bacterium]NGZ26862.1 hypothetical protein [Magnetococcales bacterium]